MKTTVHSPLVQKTKYPLVIFAGLFAAWLLFDGYEAGGAASLDGIYFPLYYTDVSIGFVSRTFIGTLAKLLTRDNITVGFIAGMIQTNAFLCFMLLSVILGRGLQKNGGNRLYCFLVVFLVFFKCAPRYYLTAAWLSVFDHYWLTCTLLIIVCMRRKYTKLLIPILCFVGLWINYAYLLTCLPLVFILLLYEIHENKAQRKYNTAIFVFSAVVGAAATIYFIVFANDQLKMTLEQVHSYVGGRMPEFAKPDFIQIDFYMFNAAEERVPTSLEELKSIGLLSFYRTFENYGFSFELSRGALFGIVPFLAAAEVFFASVYRRSRERAERLLVLLTMLLPLVAYVASFTGGDDFRFLNYGAMTQAACIMFLLSRKNAAVCETAERLRLLCERQELSGVFLCGAAAFLSCASSSMWYVSLEFLAFTATALLLARGKPLLAAAACGLLTLADECFAVTFAPLFVSILAYDAMCFKGVSVTVRGKRVKADKLRAQKLLCAAAVLCAAAIRAGVGFASGRLSLEVMSHSSAVKAAVFVAAIGCLLALSLRRLKGLGGLQPAAAFACLGAAGAVVSLFVTMRSQRGHIDSRYLAAVIVLFTVFFPLCLPHGETKQLRLRVGEFEKNEPFFSYAVPAAIALLASAAV